MRLTGLLINGDNLAADGGRTFERYSPVTDQPVTLAAAASVDDALRAVATAARAFPAWSATAPGERRRRLIAAAEALRARSGDIVDAMADEVGSTESWAQFNIEVAVDMLLEAASMPTQIHGQVIPSNRSGSLAMALRQPAGVVFSMAPWNAPVVLGVRALAMPLACGNTVVMKSSEICPRTHHLVVQAMIEGGIPAAAISLISNAPEDAYDIVNAVISHPSIRRINFTGSTRVGRVIAEIAARNLKRVLLELGGKAPMVVLDDADLQAAVDAAVFSGFVNQGQICMSTERLVVQQGIAKRFVPRFAERVRALKAGHPRAGGALGPVIDRAAAKRIQGLIDDALAKGVRLLAGGEAEGTIMQATVLDEVTPAMHIYREECFGPVVSIIHAGNDDEAVRIANDTEYGLAAAVFGRDVNHALAIARRIDSGICHINGPTVHDEAQMPFGGVKASGYGRFGGQAGIDEFTELRWITIQDGEVDYPF